MRGSPWAGRRMMGSRSKARKPAMYAIKHPLFIHQAGKKTRDLKRSAIFPVFDEPLVALLDALAQRGLGFPAEGFEAADVEELAGGAVGFAGVELDLAFKTDDFSDEFGQLADAEIDARADVDEIGAVGLFEEVDAGIGEVVDVEELALGSAGAPEGDAGCVVDLGLVEFANQRGQDVAAGEVEVVAGAVEVGGHDAEVAGAVLGVVGFAELDASDLGDGVGLVGVLQGAGEQRIFAHGLSGEPRVNAG